MKTKVEIALLELAATQIRQTLVTNIIASILVGFVLAPTFGVINVGLWVAAGIALSVARIRFAKTIELGDLIAKQYQSTLIRLQFSVFLSGLHWGSAGWFFLNPSYPDDYIFVYITIIGMVSASLTSLCAIHKFWVTFAITVFVCVIVRIGEISGWPIVVMSCVFMFGMLGLSKTLSKRISESIITSFENKDLLEDVRLAKDLADQSNLEKSRFMAAASHDLRQPLQAQGLLLEALKGQLKDDAQQELLAKINNSNNALNKLFGSLMEISQLDANTVTVNLSHQPFNKFCQELMDEFEALAKDKGLSLTLTGDECIIISDPILLKRIIRNLLSNALKHTVLGGVEIRIEKVDDSARVSVIDTGIGIPESEHTEIFKEYVQLHNDARDRNKGVGLGLALVRRMCALLEHPISLDSSPGQGACFSITLPLGDPKKVIEVEEPNNVSNIEGLSILVIDNEQAILDAMQALESQWKCSFQLFSSIEQAESSFLNNKRRPNLIISDYRLADDITGVDAIDRLRALHKYDVPAVLISGDTGVELMSELRNKGFYLLQKPINATQLRTVISVLAA